MTVEEIQAALLARGYDIGPNGADGDAGPATIAALTAFQHASGLVPDGIAGPLTVAALTDEAPAGRRAETPIPPWMPLARAEVGVIEKIGEGSNPQVLAYFKDAGFAGIKDDEVAWCAAFVGAILHRSGFDPSGSLAARSYEGWGVGLKTPIFGCVGVKKRENGAEWQGHLGFVVAASASGIVLLGGNQNNRVSIASFPRDTFTAFRWPAKLPLPSDPLQLPKSIASAERWVKEA